MLTIICKAGHHHS